MAGKSPVVASAAQRRDLIILSHSRDRGEADRARALLLTLAGWTSSRIAEAFGVREDTVRLWRSAFSKGGVDALRRSVAPGPAPIKAERALAVAEAVLSAELNDIEELWRDLKRHHLAHQTFGGSRKPRRCHRRGGHDAQWRTKSSSVGQPPNCCLDRAVAGMAGDARYVKKARQC